MRTLADDELAVVIGGMRWEQFPRSTNVEDRRRWRDDGADVLDPRPRPVPLPPRRPRDL